MIGLDTLALQAHCTCVRGWGGGGERRRGTRHGHRQLSSKWREERDGLTTYIYVMPETRGACVHACVCVIYDLQGNPVQVSLKSHWVVVFTHRYWIAMFIKNIV